MDIFKTLLIENPPNLALEGQVSYQGTWDASANSPALASGSGTKGYYYVVSVAGSTNLDGITDWKVGDWAIYNGTAWQKVDNTDAVASVFGRTGAVTAVSTDYSGVGITNTAIGASNPSTGAFTTLSASGNLTVSGGTITGGSSGLTVNAGATNQNITLSTSGTGLLNVSGANIFMPAGTGPSTTLSYIGSAYAVGHGSYRAQITFGAEAFGSTDAGFIGFRTSSTYNTGTLSEVARFTSAGNLLLGTTTDSSNGKLQLANHTTIAGGIGFHSNGTTIYTPNSTELIVAIGNSRVFDFTSSGFVGNGTGNTFLLKPSPGGGAAAPDYTFVSDTGTGMYRNGASSLGFSTGGVAALTLNSSQNASFNGINLYCSAKYVQLGTSSAPTTGLFANFRGFYADTNVIGSFIGSLGPDSVALGSATNHKVQLYTNQTLALTVDTSQTLLIGTSTNSSNGRIQLASSTSSSGGIGFGTDVPLYRSAANILNLGDANSKFVFKVYGGVAADQAPVLSLFRNGQREGFIAQGINSGSLWIGNTGGLANYNDATLAAAAGISLDSSNNATFAGKITTNTAITSGTGTAATFNGSASNPGGGMVAILAPNLGAGGQVGVGIGKGSGYSAGNSGFIYWDNDTSSLFLDTYSSTSPVVVKGSRLTLNSPLRLNNAYVAGAPTATGYVTIQDSAGNTYKVLVGT